MHRITVAAAIAALSVGIATPVDASENGWNDAGTIAKNALVVAAFGVPAVQGDWEGVLEAGGSIGGTIVITQGLLEESVQSINRLILKFCPPHA